MQDNISASIRVLEYKDCMKLVILAFLLVCSLQAEDKPYKGPSEKDVIELDPTTFQDIVYSSEDPWLIELYAPWCGHCTTLRPEWAKLATSLQGKIKVAKIDPSDNAHRPRFHKLYELVGFPRIIMLPEGPKTESVYEVYDGARTASAIEEWAFERMKVQRGYRVDRLTAPSKWQENCVEAGASLCVIVLLPTLLDSTIQERNVYLETVRSAINGFRTKPVSVLWAQAGDHPDFEEQFNLRSGFPTTILLNPGRRVFTIMKSSLTEENLVQWLEEILRSKGGRRFGRYTKDLSFSTIEGVEAEAAVDQDEL